MTMEQLSAYTVKIQIEQEELPLILPRDESADSTASLQRMLLFLLARAEAFSGIPFRSSKVTAELLSTPEGSVIVYLTAKGQKPNCVIKAYGRMGAVFSDTQTLGDCCAALEPYLEAETRSSLYRVKEGTLLVLEHLTVQSKPIRHLLVEFSEPCAVSSQTLARLAEYGQCLYPQNAVQAILSEKSEQYRHNSDDSS